MCVGKEDIKVLIVKRRDGVITVSPKHMTLDFAGRKVRKTVLAKWIW